MTSYALLERARCNAVPDFPLNHLQGEQQRMMRRNVLIGFVLFLALMCTGLVVAQKPVKNVSAKKHPNIAAAQRLSAQAYEKVVAAQKANEWDMEGHAQKAKDLLDQANQELKQAAEAANKNK
jgi:F0F1-type ATP synthase membrane subunit b/b'